MSWFKMKRQILQLLSIVLLITVSQSCSKESIENSAAIVRQEADFEDGGCSWVLEINFQRYQARNLGDEFKIKNLPVYIYYVRLNEKAECPVPNNYGGIINISRIEQIF